MAIPYLNDIDLNQNELQNAVIQGIGTVPTGVEAGQIWFNTGDHYLYYYDGTNSIPIKALNFETNNSNIKVAGSASVGSLSTVPRADHVHPAQTSVSGNAGTATTLQTARTIDGVSFDGSANVIHYGECSTAATTAAKTVTLTGETFVLATGARVDVKMSYGNTADHPTLNVNSTGAKEIYFTQSGQIATEPIGIRTWAAGSVVPFVYDGTRWMMAGTVNATYTIGTSSDLSTGTSTLPRDWTPKVLHDYVSEAIGAANAMRFKGTVTTSTGLPTTGVQVGDTYMVNEAGTYAGQVCEVGDLIIATATTPTWTVAQTNINGAITSISGTSPISVTGSGASRTVSISAATTSAAGSMSATDKTRLNTLWESATFSNVYLNQAIAVGASGLATWQINLDSPVQYANVAVYDTASGKQVMTEVVYVSTYVYEINIIATPNSTIAAGKYAAHVSGKVFTG